MASEVPAAAPPAPAEPAPNPTTITSLPPDQLLEIFVRLPNLRALVRAALTCRSWIGAVRSSPPFRRRFLALHPPPLMGFFVDPFGAIAPYFVPGPDPDVTAALRCGDFLLHSLPVDQRWGVADCRHGFVLLWNSIDKALALLNPVTRAVHRLPMPPDDIRAGTRRYFAFHGFHLLSSDVNPRSFRVVCFCGDKLRVRAAVFSSETWDWVIHPWVELEVHDAPPSSRPLVDGSIYWPCYGRARMIRINTATMDITNVDLPSESQLPVRLALFNFVAGETRDGGLCIVQASWGSVLRVWIQTVDGDGIQSWILHMTIPLAPEIDRITQGLGLQGELIVLQVRDGCAYLSTTQESPIRPCRSWFFYLCLETMKLDLVIQGRYDDTCGHPYFMACPLSLVGDDEAQ